MHAMGSGQTDVGQVRENNEDGLLVDNDLGLYVVSDGMGGHAAGEAASEAAIAAVERIVRDERSQVHRVRNGLLPADQLEELLARAVRGACREVYRLATSRPDLAGMGCTLTALLVAGHKAAMAHVGDSRLYLCRDAALHQLSTDHTLVEELVKAGVIAPEEAHKHPFANTLTRAVGSQEFVRVDSLMLDVLPNDRYLLCSDGLSNYATDVGDLAARVGDGDIESVPEQLVEFANAAGGRDNITAIVVGIEVDPAEQQLAVASDIEVKLDVLSTVFLFEDLTLAQLARVLGASRVESFEAGAVVLERDEPCDRLFVVLEGCFLVERDGRSKIELKSGDHVGETTLLRRRPSRASMRALQSGRLLTLDGEAFRALARSRPWLGVALFERLGRRLSLAADRQAHDGRGTEAVGAELL